METPPGFQANVAHIVDSDKAFQVLLPDESDWDEQATRLEYEQWIGEL
jgi:hypothetical protein